MTGRLERYRALYFTGSSTERVVFFSDAVFAIAMTLLVLEIKVPELSAEQVEAGELGRALVEQLPHVFGYALSFLFIAVTWIGHHNIWKFIERYTAALMWLNILLLMLIAFLPVPTALIAVYGPTAPVAPIVYAVTVAAIGLVNLAIWVFARSRRLLSPLVEPELYRMVRRRLLLGPAVFLASVVVALVDPLVAMLSWTALWLVYFVSSRQMAGWLRRRDAEDVARTSAPVSEPG